MPYLTCPNCGYTVRAAIAAPDPGACPQCCAHLHTPSTVSWQRWPRSHSTMPTPRLRLFLPTSPEAPWLCRRALEGLRDELGDPLTDTLRLLLCEVVTNAVVHTEGHSPRRAIATVTLTPAWVRAEVRDSGPGFRPRVGAPRLDMESGWGLHLVDALSTDWGVVSCEGSWVWFELARSAVRDEPREAVAS